GVYPSGSVIKPIIALAALEYGIITKDTSVVSTGVVSVGSWTFLDWKRGGHGITNVRKAIAESVNTFFYYIGGGYRSFPGLGIERLAAYFQKVYMGSTFDIDLPGEGAGFVPTPKWKEETKGEVWYIGDTYNVSIG
ncbi:MAG: penicillin-binding transpeptidase domain-containing protein, partial [Patescibacteria group bacterium]